MIEGLVTVPCRLTAAEAADRIEREVAARGMRVFARIDHGAGAAAVGLALPPTIVVVFGDPRGGTLLMESVQAIGLELPLRMLCATDAGGESHLSYTDPRWLAGRFGASAPAVVEKMAAVLAELARVVGA